MEYPQITPNEENNNINNKEIYNNSNLNSNEIIPERNHILKKISSIPETFNLGLDKIKQDFTNSYTIYLQNLLKNLNTCDTSIEQNIDSVNLKNNYYLEVNSLLGNMLEQKMNFFQDYLRKIVDITQNLLDKSIEDDFSKGNDFVQQIILKQKEEKQKEELEKRKKEEEMKMKKKEEEIKINEYLDIISYECNKKIIEQMENDICKIINKNNEQYTGFICKIPYPDINNMIKVLITYNNIINEEIIIETKKYKRKINIKNRMKYINKLYNIIIIEIKEEDNINNYLELDDNIINNIIK